MKRYIIPAIAALLALAACTKQGPVQEPAREIGFQVANYVQTKADAPVKFTNKDFGTFAWHYAGDGTVSPFMKNEQVGQKGSEWKTLNNTYYWPKSGSLNFVSYSPYSADKAPAVSETSIAWTAYTVAGDDLMYADKANGQTENITPGTYNAVSGANGVPTLFHHALAKLSFKAKATFLEYTADDNNKSKTTWVVTLKNATLKGIWNTGDLALNIADDNVTWKTDGWKADAAKTAEAVELVTAKDGLVLKTDAQDLYDGNSFFVLPQALAAKAQAITLVFHIKTTHIATTDKKEGVGQGTIVIDQDYSKTIDLREVSSLAAWQMNQNIVYTICIKPTATDPNNPHTDDPEDVVITFDPAQNGWEDVKDATIQI